VERVKVERVKVERVKVERVKVERAKVERAKVERAKVDTVKEVKEDMRDTAGRVIFKCISKKKERVPNVEGLLPQPSSYSVVQ